MCQGTHQHPCPSIMKGHLIRQPKAIADDIFWRSRPSHLGKVDFAEAKDGRGFNLFQGSFLLIEQKRDEFTRLFFALRRQILCYIANRVIRIFALPRRTFAYLLPYYNICHAVIDYGMLQKCNKKSPMLQFCYRMIKPLEKKLEMQYYNFTS